MVFRIVLSGNSLESLEWTILDQKLQYPRYNHVLYIIPDKLMIRNFNYPVTKKRFLKNARCNVL